MSLNKKVRLNLQIIKNGLKFSLLMSVYYNAINHINAHTKMLVERWSANLVRLSKEDMIL